MHDMRLGHQFFEEIRGRRKTVEIRLNDEKRQLISRGDRICFSSRESPDEVVVATVVGLRRFGSLGELLTAYPFQRFGRVWNSTQEAIAAVTYYSAADVIKFGYLAIEIELI